METRKILLYWVKWSLSRRSSHAVVVDADGFTESVRLQGAPIVPGFCCRHRRS